jgi:hypothetical protein
MPVLPLPVGKYDTSPPLPLGTSANAGELETGVTRRLLWLLPEEKEDGVWSME